MSEGAGVVIFADVVTPLEVGVADGVATIAGQRGFVGVGHDGSNYQFIHVDSTGRQTVVGAGTAGTPAGGVLSVQGISGGQALPVSVAALPLPSGAATEGTLATRLAEATFTARIPVLGQKVMVASVPTVIASDQTAVRVRGKDADGAAVTENPVLVAGWDETSAQTLFTDTSGRQRVVGAAADGAAAAGDPVQVAGVDGSGNTQSVRMETDGTVRVKDDFIDDRAKVVGVAFAKFGPTALSATTYFLGVDVSNTTDYRHTAGTEIVVVQTVGKAQKSNAGSKWALQLLIVLRIDGTDSDLSVLPAASVSLQDTSKLSTDEQINNFWPHVPNLAVSGGGLTYIASNAVELNVAAVNTGTTLEDVAGNLVAPAVGDMLIRALLVSGGGTFEFAYGIQYWVQ